MNEIIAALYTRLDGQLAIPVYDHVPQDTQDYPFIRINPIQTENDDTVSKNGLSASVDIIAFSRYRGLSELYGVIDAVYNALHHWEMGNTASYAVGNFIEQSRTIINDPDGLTRNSIQNYTFFIEPL